MPSSYKQTTTQKHSPIPQILFPSFLPYFFTSCHHNGKECKTNTMEHPFLVPILIDFSVSVCACVWGHFFVFLKTIRSNNFSFFPTSSPELSTVLNPKRDTTHTKKYRKKKKTKQPKGIWLYYSLHRTASFICSCLIFFFFFFCCFSFPDLDIRFRSSKNIRTRVSVYPYRVYCPAVVANLINTFHIFGGSNSFQLGWRRWK